MCLRTEMCKCFLEDKVLQLRVHTYNEHIRAIGINNDLIREYGIKGECCLNQLRYLHCANSFPADVAHDMFEGVIVDVLINIIVYCVQSGYFSLADVNEKIKSFPYSGSDKKRCTSAIHYFFIN